MRALASERFPELASFVRAVEEAYSGRLYGVYLFGSRARGNARQDSDYDVAVVLKHLGDFWVEKLRLADLAFDQMLARGIHVQAHPFGLDEWEASDREDLVLAVRRVAVELTS